MYLSIYVAFKIAKTNKGSRLNCNYTCIKYYVTQPKCKWNWYVPRAKKNFKVRAEIFLAAVRLQVAPCTHASRHPIGRHGGSVIWRSCVASWEADCDFATWRWIEPKSRCCAIRKCIFHSRATCFIILFMYATVWYGFGTRRTVHGTCKYERDET